LAVDAQLHYFIRQTVLRYSDWITPILSRIELQKEAKMLAPHKQGFSLNQLADVYESILGAIFATEFRFDEVMSFLAATHNPLMAIAYNPAHLSGTFLVDPGCQLEYAFETSFLELAGTAPQLTEFDIRAIQSTKTKFQQQAKSYDHPRYSPYSKYVPSLTARWLDYFQTEILGYTFKNIWLLVEALTQTGFESRAGLVPDYQRLEFLGDAVLECFIMGNIFRGFQGRTVTPHIMHKIKLQMLTNQSMGRMAMLKGFYAFLNPCTEIDEFAFACDFKLPLHRL
jgi:dsRNA-specific ribonuclease